MPINYNQKMQPQKAGQPIEARSLSNMLEAMFLRIKGGKGILVKRLGQNVIIENLGAVGLGGGATSGRRIVEELPPLPTSGWDEVFWTSVGAGNGDDQPWGAGTGAGVTEWAPLYYVSAKSGVPIP